MLCGIFTFFKFFQKIMYKLNESFLYKLLCRPASVYMPMRIYARSIYIRMAAGRSLAQFLL